MTTTPHMPSGEHKMKLKDYVEALDPNPALTKAYAEHKADYLCHHDGCLNDSVPFDYFCAQHTSIGTNPSTQPAEFVPHVEAKEIAQRFIDRHFGNTDKEFPRISIPADARRDDDLRIMAYIGQCIDTAARLREVEEAHRLEQMMRRGAEAEVVRLEKACDDHFTKVLENYDQAIKAEAQRDGLLEACNELGYVMPLADRGTAYYFALDKLAAAIALCAKEMVEEEFFKKKYDPDCKQLYHPWGCGCPLTGTQDLLTGDDAPLAGRKGEE